MTILSGDSEEIPAEIVAFGKLLDTFTIIAIWNRGDK